MGKSTKKSHGIYAKTRGFSEGEGWKLRTSPVTWRNPTGNPGFGMLPKPLAGIKKKNPPYPTGVICGV